jgi:hypothetical protein
MEPKVPSYEFIGLYPPPGDCSSQPWKFSYFLHLRLGLPNDFYFHNCTIWMYLSTELCMLFIESNWRSLNW